MEEGDGGLGMSDEAETDQPSLAHLLDEVIPVSWNSLSGHEHWIELLNLSLFASELFTFPIC